MCVCLPYNLRNWVVCSKPSSKPLLPIHITKCNKGNKNHQAKEWRDTSIETATFCEESKTGRNSNTLWDRERLFFNPKSLQLLWVVVVVLLADLWWLWVKRERRRGLGEIWSKEGEIGFVGMVGFTFIGF